MAQDEGCSHQPQSMGVGTEPFFLGRSKQLIRVTSRKQHSQDGSVLFPKRKSELRMAEASMFRSSARRRPRDYELAPPSRGFPLPCHPSRGSGRPRTAARKRANMCRDTWFSSEGRRAVTAPLEQIGSSRREVCSLPVSLLFGILPGVGRN